MFPLVLLIMWDLPDPWILEPFDFRIETQVYAESFEIESPSKDILGDRWALNCSIYLPFMEDVECFFNISAIGLDRFLWDSFSLGVEHQLMNDLTGDDIALSLTGNFRYATPESVKNPSTGHHSSSDFQIGLFVGKEFTKDLDYIARSTLFAFVGQGNFGWPWISLGGECRGRWSRLDVVAFLVGRVGLGGLSIDLDNFTGYGSISYRSIDVGVAIEYTLPIQGIFKASYVYRAFAESFPMIRSFTISYNLPISLLL